MSQEEKRRELDTLRQNLTYKTNEYKGLCMAVPPLEKAYQEAKATESLKLRAEGENVGMIDKTIRGRKNVSDLRFDRDIAIAQRDACRMSIKALEVSINALQTEINSEMKEFEMSGQFQT